MPIDRRITNGLAYAGALLIVAVPAADFVIRQFHSGAPQVAVVEETPVAAPAAAKPATTPQLAETKPAAAKPEAVDPVTTQATARPAAGTKPATGNAVDDFVNSGRQLPSYISGGSTASATSAPAKTPTAPQPAQAAATPKPATQTAAVPATQQPVVTPSQPSGTVASVPSAKSVTFPTPVSQRPPSVPSTQQAATQPYPAATSAGQAPLIIDQPRPVTGGNNVVTADDLRDWESGPLSEFLARRNGGNAAPDRDVVVGPADDYDPNGFFLDQGPNTRVQRLPPAYVDDGSYYR